MSLYLAFAVARGSTGSPGNRSDIYPPTNSPHNIGNRQHAHGFITDRDTVAAVACAPVASLVGLVVALTITFFWKISIHAGVAAWITTIFVILFGPWMLLMAPFVMAVGWARVRLGDHSTTQT